MAGRRPPAGADSMSMGDPAAARLRIFSSMSEQLLVRGQACSRRPTRAQKEAVDQAAMPIGMSRRTVDDSVVEFDDAKPSPCAFRLASRTCCSKTFLLPGAGRTLNTHRCQRMYCGIWSHMRLASLRDCSDSPSPFMTQTGGTSKGLRTISLKRSGFNANVSPIG